MARFFILFLVGVALFGLMSSPATAIVVFQDDFEDDTVGVSVPNAPPIGDYWHPYYGVTNKRYVATNPESEPTNTSSQALFLSRYADMGGQPHSHIQAMITAADQATIEANGQLTIEYKYYDAGGTGNYGIASNANKGGPSYYAPSVASLEFRDIADVLKVRGAPGAWSDLNYEHDTWHAIKIDVDFATDTFVFSVDGVTHGDPANYVFPAAGTTTINNVLFSCGYYPCEGYIDDLVITTVPEPSTLALLVIGMLGTALCCRRTR